MKPLVGVAYATLSSSPRSQRGKIGWSDKWRPQRKVAIVSRNRNGLFRAGLSIRPSLQRLKVDSKIRSDNNSSNGKISTKSKI